MVLALLLALALTPSHARASITAQVPDYIVLDGKRELLHTNPLNDFLTAQNSRRLPGGATITSAKWRGYLATWEVRNGRLLLTRIDVELLDSVAPAGERSTRSHNALCDLFPGDSDVPATWFTGNLIIPRGDLIRYAHLGYASIYQQYTILEVVSGMISRRTEMNASEFEAFRRDRFEAFKRTDAYAYRRRPLGGRASGLDIENVLYDIPVEEYLRQPVPRL